MIPIETLSIDTFAPLQGSGFTLKSEDLLIDLSLHEVRKLGHKREEALRDPFSLHFRGPQGLRLPQGIYGMTCDSLGEIELFITQIADGAQGSEFEAVFT